MKTRRKHIILAVLIGSMMLSLTACGQEKQYKSYIESLITANYLGISDEYLEMTGADEVDATAMYLENASRLAENLIIYYGMEINDDPSLAPDMVDLAKAIYGKAKFEISPAKKMVNDYYVDVTIYPINIINQSEAGISMYVDSFNQDVDSGIYNNTDRASYEREFANGIIAILDKNLEDVEYLEPQTITVKILQDDDSYYISDNDMIAIDNLIVMRRSTAYDH